MKLNNNFIFMKDLLILSAACFGLLFIVGILYHKDIINTKTYFVLGFLVLVVFVVLGLFC